MKGKIFNAQEVQAILNGSKVMFREIAKIKLSIASYNFDTKQFYNDPIFKKCPYQVGQKIFVKERWVLVEDHLDYETGGEWSVREWKGSFEEAQAHLNGDARFGLKASVYYPADGEDENPCEMHDCIGIGGKLLQEKEIPWRSAKSMPQWASRLTLLIKEIRVERLVDISEEDAIKEGVNKLFTEEEMKHVLRVHQIEKNDTYKNYLWHGHIGRTITKKQSDEWEYQCSAYEKAKDSFFSLWNATHKKPEEKFEVNPFVWVVDFKIIN